MKEGRSIVIIWNVIFLFFGILDNLIGSFYIAATLSYISIHFHKIELEQNTTNPNPKKQPNKTTKTPISQYPKSPLFLYKHISISIDIQYKKKQKYKNPSQKRISNPSHTHIHTFLAPKQNILPYNIGYILQIC